METDNTARRQVALRLLVAVPLCMFAAVLAVGAMSSDNGGEYALLQTDSTSAQKQQAGLQQVERLHVMKCAKEITGDDTPRKLEPAVRDKVMACAKAYMPPVKTKELLKKAAEKLMGAATTEAEKADASKVLASSKDTPHKAQIISDTAHKVPSGSKSAAHKTQTPAATAPAATRKGPATAQKGPATAQKELAAAKKRPAAAHKTQASTPLAKKASSPEVKKTSKA